MNNLKLFYLIRYELRNEAECSCGQYGTSWSEGAGENYRVDYKDKDGNEAWRFVVVTHHAWCPIALVERVMSRIEKEIKSKDE